MYRAVHTRKHVLPIQESVFCSTPPEVFRPKTALCNVQTTDSRRHLCTHNTLQSNQTQQRGFVSGDVKNNLNHALGFAREHSNHCAILLCGCLLSVSPVCENKTLSDSLTMSHTHASGAPQECDLHHHAVFHHHGADFTSVDLSWVSKLTYIWWMFLMLWQANTWIGAVLITARNGVNLTRLANSQMGDFVLSWGVLCRLHYQKSVKIFKIRRLCWFFHTCAEGVLSRSAKTAE